MRWRSGIGPHVDDENQTADWMSYERENEKEPEKVCKDAYTGVMHDSAVVGETKRQELECVANLQGDGREPGYKPTR